MASDDPAFGNLPDNDSLKDIFLAAVEIESIEAQEAFVSQACGSDHVLRGEVRRLIKAFDRVGDFLEPVNQTLVGALVEVEPRGCSPPRASAMETREQGQVNESSSVVSQFDSAADLGRVIADRFQLSHVLGEGGMGIVYSAQQVRPVQRSVAIKVIKPGMDSRRVLARFEAERQALARMDHPNIARILDGGIMESGRPFFVMELVEGIPLSEYCDQQRLTIRARLELLIQVCAAVQHAHQKGIIHRDLKSSNVLVAEYDGRPVPRVIDFGLAKAMGEHPLAEPTYSTLFGVVAGTLSYMAPEQVARQPMDVDTRADIYALGVVLYELLTGTTPLERDRVQQTTWDEARRLICEEEPPRPSSRLLSADSLESIAKHRDIDPHRLRRLVKGDLDWITLKCLEKDRARRYETAEAMGRDLGRFLANEPLEAGPPTRTYRLKKFAQRHRGPIAVGLLLFAAIISSLLIALFSLAQVQQSRTLARLRAVEAEAAWLQEAEQRRQAEAYSQQLETTQQAEIQHRLMAEASRERAEAERRIAQAVREFLERDLLNLANPDSLAVAIHNRPEIMRAPENPTVRELLDRAATRLHPEYLEPAFQGQPEVRASLMLTVGEAYYAIGEYARAVEHLRLARHKFVTLKGKTHPDSLHALASLVLALGADGQIAESRTLLNQLRNESPLSPKSPDLPSRRMLATISLLAISLFDAGHMTDAAELFEQVYQVQFELLGEFHHDSLVTLSNLGVALFEAGDHSRALETHSAAYTAWEQEYGIEHDKTLEAGDQRAIAWSTLGNKQQAIEWLRHSYQVLVANLGADDRRTLETQRRLGETLVNAGHLGEGLSTLEEAWHRQRQHLGPHDRTALATMQNLGDAYARVKRADEALDMLQLARSQYEENLGATHPRTLSATGDIVPLLRDRGDLDQAIELAEVVYDGYRNHFGPDHPRTLISINNLALEYKMAGRLPEAIELYLSALEVRMAVHGLAHPSTVSVLWNLCWTYNDHGDSSNALIRMEQAMEGLTRIDFQHHHAAVILKAVAATQERRRKLGEAEVAARALLAIVAREAGEQSNDYAEVLTRLSRLLTKQQQWAESETLLRQSLAIYDTDPESWQARFDNCLSLADLLIGQERFSDAEVCLLDGRKRLLENELGDQQLRVAPFREAAKRLVQLYETWDKPDLADPWRRQLDAPPID